MCLSNVCVFKPNVCGLCFVFVWCWCCCCGGHCCLPLLSVAGAFVVADAYYDGLFFFWQKLCYFFYHAFLHASRFNNKRMTTMVMMSFCFASLFPLPPQTYCVVQAIQTQMRQTALSWIICGMLLLLYTMLLYSVSSMFFLFVALLPQDSVVVNIESK